MIAAFPQSKGHLDSSLSRKMDLKSSIDEHIEKAPWGANDQIEPYMRAGLTQDDAEFLYSWDSDPKRQAKVFHKVDWRLCPMLALLYLISHLDRYGSDPVVCIH